MPVRDWRCDKCGYILEDIYFHKESELKLPKICKACKKQTTWTRLPASVVVRVKGGTPKYHVSK